MFLLQSVLVHLEFVDLFIHQPQLPVDFSHLFAGLDELCLQVVDSDVFFFEFEDFEVDGLLKLGDPEF